MTFKHATTLTAVAFFSLFAALMASPGVLYWLFGLTPHVTGDVLVRRAAILFLMLGLMAWGLRGAEDQNGQKTAVWSMTIGLVAIALLGLVEWLRGVAGPGIFLAIGIEVGLAWALWTCKRAPAV